MLGSPLDAQGQPMFRSGQAQPKPPQQQGAPYGQQFNYADWLQQGRPESGQAAWQQAGSPKSRPQGGNYQAWSPQNIQPFTQALNTPFGQMNPGQYYQQRDAFIQSANNQMGQYMPGQQMHGQAPQFNVGQMWGQAGDMVQQGWQNPFAQWQQPAAQPAQQNAAAQPSQRQPASGLTGTAGIGQPAPGLTSMTFAPGTSASEQNESAYRLRRLADEVRRDNSPNKRMSFGDAGRGNLATKYAVGQAMRPEGPAASPGPQQTPTQQEFGPGGLRTADFRDHNSDGVDDRDQGVNAPFMPPSQSFRPGQAEPIAPPSQGTPYGVQQGRPDQAPAAPGINYDALAKYRTATLFGNDRRTRTASEMQFAGMPYEEMVRKWNSGEPLGDPVMEQRRSMGYGPMHTAESWKSMQDAARPDLVRDYERLKGLPTSRFGDARGYEAAFAETERAGRESGLFSEEDFKALRAKHDANMRHENFTAQYNELMRLQATSTSPSEKIALSRQAQALRMQHMQQPAPASKDASADPFGYLQMANPAKGKSAGERVMDAGEAEQLPFFSQLLAGDTVTYDPSHPQPYRVYDDTGKGVARYGRDGNLAVRSGKGRTGTAATAGTVNNAAFATQQRAQRETEQANQRNATAAAESYQLRERAFGERFSPDQFASPGDYQAARVAYLNGTPGLSPQQNEDRIRQMLVAPTSRADLDAELKRLRQTYRSDARAWGAMHGGKMDNSLARKAAMESARRAWQTGDTGQFMQDYRLRDSEESQSFWNRVSGWQSR